ncbi:MAG: hypothetical protein ABI690_14190 [Chloroflexota bacterium]
MTTFEKPKRRFRRGCIIAGVFLLLIPALCYGCIWLFARYGGEWATDRDIPIPDNSQFVKAIYEEDFYTKKHSLYLHYATPEELRGWFIVQARIGLTPIALDSEQKRFIDNNDFYMESPTFHQTTFLSQLQEMSAIYTSGWFGEVVSDCQGVHIYKNHAAAVRDFPDQNLPDDKTLFVISTCWPNVK